MTKKILPFVPVIKAQCSDLTLRITIFPLRKSVLRVTWLSVRYSNLSYPILSIDDQTRRSPPMNPLFLISQVFKVPGVYPVKAIAIDEI